MAAQEGTAFEPFLNPFSGRAEEVRAVVEPTIDGMGCELVNMHFLQGQRKTLVRLFVDKKAPARGIGLDTLEVLNRTVGDLLDVEDEARGLFRGTWDLEVSSPGVDRPLAKRSHFAQAVGERVKVRTRGLVAGKKAHTGRLDATSDEGVTLTAEGEEPVQIPWASVDEAHVVFVFEAPKSRPSKTVPPKTVSPKTVSPKNRAKEPSKKAKRA